MPDANGLSAAPSPSPAPTRAETVIVALGSNLGDRAAHLSAARDALAALPGTHVIALSDVEETAPLGPPGQGAYLNQMAALLTTLRPLDLLDHLLAIERARGRVRSIRWGARTLDLDVVRFGDQQISTPRLVVPHPELAHRAFWQRGLAQLAARLPQPAAASHP